MPIRARDEVFGNIGRTGKRGGAPLGGVDETVPRTPAVTAGAAAGNARRRTAARDRRQGPQT
ncbi:hypothetical protein [Streptomyces sp. NPDC020983]|uniref:hypothetical protein n=1 Tax=Streptomyces sp. NPDC020983 TaxID=3365106 RepID=UPI0037944DA2